MEVQPPANLLLNLYRTVRRQIELGQRLEAGGGTATIPARVPGCPELAGDTPSYHATVYLDVYSQGGTYQGRTPVNVSFGTRITGSEIIDLAIANANRAISQGQSASGGTSPRHFGVRSRIDPSSASIGRVCYA